MTENECVTFQFPALPCEMLEVAGGGWEGTEGKIMGSGAGLLSTRWESCPHPPSLAVTLSKLLNLSYFPHYKMELLIVRLLQRCWED